MTIITSTMLADIHARRLKGEPLDEVAARHNVKPITAYQSLRRKFGLIEYPKRPRAANDNVPGRVTRMSPHNGGCSTLSGMVPVTLARVPTVDGVAGEERVAA